MECWRCPGAVGPPDKSAQLSGHCQGEEAFIERRFEMGFSGKAFQRHNVVVPTIEIRHKTFTKVLESHEL